MTTSDLKIYCDGGSRGNPGPAASAFIVLDVKNSVVHEQGFYLGITTNNQAEYQAVIEALKWLSTTNYSQAQVEFYLDSLLVVNQINGLYKIKDQNLLKKYQEVKEIISDFEIRISNFVHILRASNSRADALVNKTLDSVQI